MDSMIAPPSPIGDLLLAQQDTAECTNEGLWQTYVTLRPKYVSAIWIWIVWAWNIMRLGIDLIAQATHIVGSTGLGWRPIVLLIRLTLYSIFLLPGLSKVIVYYFCCPHVMRSIPYGSKGRHKVDLYLPCAAHPACTSQESDASESTGDSAAEDTAPPAAGDAEGDASSEAAGRTQGSPVVVFITGGAWMIGYRAWGALLARRLSIAGVLVACVDYGNFPLSAQDVGEMLSDVNLGVRWVLDNIQHYGGDPSRVHLVGQSAGGHLAALALLLQAAAAQHDAADAQHAPLASQQQHSTQQQQRTEAEDAEQAVADLAAVLQTHARWHPHELAGFVGVSGVYDILGLQTHFGSLGLGPGVVDRLFSVKGRPSMQLLSPLHCLLPLAEVASSTGAGGAAQAHAAGSSSKLAASADCDGSSCRRLSEDDVTQQDCSNGSSSHSNGQRAEDLAVSTGCQLAITSPSVHHRHGHALHAHKDQRSAARPCAKPTPQHLRQQHHQHHLLPAITLLHGAQDRTVPCHVSEAFACALQRAGAARSVRLRVYSSETHTSPLVENPMRGGRDELTDAILAAVVGQEASSGHTRLCPERLIQLATAVCPF